MSRDTSAGTTTAPAAGRRVAGRHRIDRPAGVRCADLPGVAERLAARPQRGGWAFLRSLRHSVPAGRHTWDFLAGAGGRPRTAFAIILSL